MTDLTGLSLPELAAAVQERLETAGVRTVLSGGSCVTALSGEAYVSDDIDLIREGFATRDTIRRVMADLGFVERSRYFTHPDTRFVVEFPPGPPMVGEEPPNRIDTLVLSTGRLRLLSPTDCVKDRLTWWFHDGDRQCLDQAILVARRHAVDLDELRRWAVGEGRAEAFRTIEDDLRGA